MRYLNVILQHVFTAPSPSDSGFLLDDGAYLGLDDGSILDIAQ